MLLRNIYCSGVFAALLVISPSLRAQQPDLEDLREQAIKAAVRKVAPSIVQIQTSGGTDIIGSGPRGAQVRKGMGPTTGVIVSADGYIASSAFNFANKPSSIDVAVPGKSTRYVAKVVATDTTRMITLLKIDATGLPVPAATPKAQIRIGQTALALGRTLEPDVTHPPSVSEGIISATERIWGKALQTDAKVSPANYGGPLVDLEGRVLGILVPASPWAEGETAGIEWYDSGIGFAIPLEDLLAALPRLKQGQDLKKGVLGIQPKGQDRYGTLPEIAAVSPGSTAAKAGFKPGDIVKEVDGKPVVNMAQVLHRLGTKYEGDTVAIKLLRGKEEVNFPKLVLGSTASSFATPFLGILPMRDDPELGVEVRYVYPKSPADQAGIKPGDRITKIGPGAMAMGPLQPFQGRDQLAAILHQIAPGSEVRLEVARKEAKKTETITVKLVEVPDSVPERLPEKASIKKALEPRKAVAGGMPPMPPMPGEKKEEAPKKKAKPPTGLLKRTNETKDKNYWIYVPEDYDPNISYALVLWLHPVGRSKDTDIDDFKESWEDYCARNHVILAGPKAENETGWVASDAEFVNQVVQEVLNQYTIDRQRVVVHGMGLGGQMAFYLGFHNRDTFRGVATTGAVLANQVKEKLPAQPLAFYIIAGGKDPLAKAIAESKTKLIDGKYPVTYREIPNMGAQYLDLETLEELVRWIDSLDRL
jgi:S1-C subfamily serine protease/predicted esterase